MKRLKSYAFNLIFRSAPCQAWTHNLTRLWLTPFHYRIVMPKSVNRETRCGARMFDNATIMPMLQTLKKNCKWKKLTSRYITRLYYLPYVTVFKYLRNKGWPIWLCWNNVTVRVQKCHSLPVTFKPKTHKHEHVTKDNWEEIDCCNNLFFLFLLLTNGTLSFWLVSIFLFHTIYLTSHELKVKYLFSPGI